MRKPIAFFLSSILILNLFGFYLFYVFQQQSFQLQADKLAIKESRRDGQILTFSTQEYAHLNWTREHKEFKLNNNLYDVYAVKTVNGRVEVYAISDNSETDLLDGFVTFLTRQSDGEKSDGPVKNLLQHLMQEYTLTDIRHKVFQPVTKTGIIVQEHPALQTAFLELLFPPPQAV